MPINKPKQQGSALGNIVGLASKTAGIASADPTASAGPPAESDPMARRIENDPAALVHSGLEMADDPGLPLDYETRMAVIEPLLRAKHFGPGGGLS